MAFKTIYPPVGSAQRISTGVDTAPARGTIILTGGGTGAQPDFFSKEYHRARIAFRFTDGAGAEVPTGTCDIDIWYRDIVEEGDRAQNVAPNPPTATNVLWVKGHSQIGVTHLEEVVVETVYQRGLYVQVSSLAVAADVHLHIAPFDRWAPYEMVG